MLPSYQTFALTLADHVAHVQLARPAKANAMSDTLWRELGEVMDWLDQSAEVRAVVLSGQGKHFCAGMDLEVFAGVAADTAGDSARRSERLRRLILNFQESLTAVERCRKPVLAAIHGVCMGGGLALAACCDMRYAAQGSRFSIKEIDLGMTADVGTLQRLPHVMPRGLVHEMTYTGRELSAEEAVASGLVNAVLADADAVQAHALSVARQIAAKSPLAVRGCKQVLLHGRDHTVAEGLEYVATWNAGMISIEDVMQAVASGPGETPRFED